MAKIIILGTAAAVPDENHENTYMVLVGKNRMVLIDSPGSPFIRMQQCGLDPNDLTDIILTHFHPDHVSGIPPLLLSLTLCGRNQLLSMYGNQHCISHIEEMLDIFDWDSWCQFPVKFNVVKEEERQLVLDGDEFRILSSPGRHYVPTLALRIENKDTGRVTVYTSDTAPVSEIARLAKNADLLIHEATGEGAGHSSAKQAGEQAGKANAKELLLIHYPVGDFSIEDQIKQASQAFKGKIRLAGDFMEIDI